jgi:integrative and conjugative element protein (TIGR02256 family)
MQVLGHLLRLRPTKHETGGWLLGYWSADGAAVVLTHATPPGPRGAPDGVTVSDEGHSAYFEQAWNWSDGRVTFLGDWHTHPAGVPLPSSTDRAAMRQLAENAAFDTPTPLIAIVTHPGHRWGRTLRYVAFFLRQPGGAVVHLDPILLDELPAGTGDVPDWWRRHRGRAAIVDCGRRR